MTKFYRPIGDKACVFPVGAIYLSVSTTNPSKWFGGTWERLSGGYIYATSDSYNTSSYTGTGTQSKDAFTSGSTAITIAQMPSHRHDMPAYHVNSGAYKAESPELVYKDYSTTAWPAVAQNWGQHNVGGGQGHTHTIPEHSHNIAYICLICWRRTA